MAEPQRTIHAFFINDQNAFQVEQVRVAEVTARRHGLGIHFRYAEGNPMVLIHQLFESIHARSGPAPDAILVESMTADGMPRVARNAVAAGIGWGVINASAEYLGELRAAHSELPIFGAGMDNQRIGEIQAAQTLKLLGGQRGASVLCVQGPPQSSSAMLRYEALQETLSGRVELSVVDADWTREGGRSVTAEWLHLARRPVDLVVGQNDELAGGAREAVEAQRGDEVRRIPFIGCDALPAVGRAMLERGELAATIATQMPSEVAVEAFAAFYRDRTAPRELYQLVAESVPPLEQLKPA